MSILTRLRGAYRSWKDRNPAHILEEKLTKWWNAALLMTLSLMLVGSGGAQVFWMWSGAHWSLILSCAAATLFIGFVIILIGKQ